MSHTPRYDIEKQTACEGSVTRVCIRAYLLTDARAHRATHLPLLHGFQGRFGPNPTLISPIEFLLKNDARFKLQLQMQAERF